DDQNIPPPHREDDEQERQRRDQVAVKGDFDDGMVFAQNLGHYVHHREQEEGEQRRGHSFAQIVLMRRGGQGGFFFSHGYFRILKFLVLYRTGGRTAPFHHPFPPQ